MAITRGQMQRQLRRGGGIMNIAPREQFGLGSSFKKFVRKVIPNEVSKVATIAAPFVAPFNPALAATMAGVGSFDQTGSLSKALKSGALTYGGGQAARFIGGAGFQGNPLNEPLISSPLGTDTGIGRILSDRAAAKGQALRLEGVKGIGSEGLTGSDVGGNITLAESAGGTSASPTILAEQMSEASLTPRTITTATKQTTPSITKLIKEGNYIDAAVEAGKKGTKAIFLDKDGNLDKTALLAAGSFGLSYVDAKKLADDAGVDIGTESEYDEATKAEKKEEYASYLTNFFGGKKDGGRIGYMFGDRVEDKEGILSMMSTGAARAAEKQDMEQDAENQLAYFPGDVFTKEEISRLFRDRSLTTNRDRKQLYKILMNPGMYPEAEDALIKMLRGNKDGGRIGFESGTIPMADSSFKFTELIEDDTDEKEKLINALLENAREKFPEASEEDIFNFVMSKAAPMSGLMVDGKFVKSTDIETPSIKLSRDMGGPRYDFLMGGEVPVRKNKAGIEELDYRQTGGFVPVGVKEKADDVPAMLSKNEFVLTADAVRGIGGGDVEKGAEKLYGVMKQAEKVGRA